ncbi:putative integral membrane protein [Actinoplanes missouriensis 431]|uniref:Putative integral membrane protein n=1 Tax=Actinoplanes missouriensis (strain ATCC 14538 / DSM 43046 / CBS 188.64 / JCM 3121 / NBRC 102363 / NCIMB 12654 / NRRL B-3342 / UNCC 431) TaxID=512565 RepID=I0GXN4_ACTM4|nr:EamA family transporter RarD [Actinoplanes missouriensis]BAL85521.1 putative integral membrane protein [Actinoplanes missouriensis 431]
MSDERRGYLYGLTAYTLWGFFPIYFKLLQPAQPLEILAHRVVWSVLFVALLLSVARNWRFLGRLLRTPRLLGGITLAAVLIGINWGTYIAAVNSSRVVETALGYFITPLVSVLLGVTVLRERVRAWQWVAVGIGTLAVAILTVDYGHLPYVALTLAASFGCYGLIKKRMSLPPAEGLFVESGVLALPAFAFLTWLNLTGGAEFGHVSATHTLLMLLSGAATAIPLLLFAGAANRVPLVGLGILQYVAPILQLGCGVLIYHEPMPPARLAGFGLVWIALMIFTVDGIRHTRAAARERAAAEATAATATGPAAAALPAR